MSVRNYPGGPVNGVSTVGAALSGASTGVKLTYTVPAGKQARVWDVSVANFTLGPTVQARITVGGVTIVLQSGTAAFDFAGAAFLNAADTCDVNVSALVGASSFDAGIHVEEFPAT